MSEIKKDLLKIPCGLTYFSRCGGARTAQKVADSETYVMTEEHTVADILRYLISVSSRKELISILKAMD